MLEPKEFEIDLNSREFFFQLREAAEQHQQGAVTPSWKRAFSSLAQAACVMDAFLARSQVAQTCMQERANGK